MFPSRRSRVRLFDRFLSLIEVSSISDRLILRGLFLSTLCAGLFLLYAVNAHYAAPTPIYGGTFTEGIIGTPRFINPALANTRVDQDVTALIYSGLMKIDETGTLTPDVASLVTVSQDGLTYNIQIRKDVRFHDGTPLTARDVAFTIELIQNPDLKSPLRGNWIDVTVELVGEYELNIVLEEAYAPFIENFQFGIIPAHLWKELPIEQIPFSQLNTEPIGAGPFRLDNAVRDQSGIITNYTLVAFRDNAHAPHIDTFTINFYPDEPTLIKALEANVISGTAYLQPESVATFAATDTFTTITEPLPRVFGIFLNQNKSAALRDNAVREALSIAVNRTALIEKTLFGYGVPSTGPTVTKADTLESEDSSDVAPEASATEAASLILKEAGWVPNNLGLLEKQIEGNAETLSLTLRTSNAPLFDAVTKQVVDDWKAIGVDIASEQFEQTGLVQSVIRPRDFQALLFGVDMNRSGDLYPFWHSSQRDDPGLNIAQYTNVSVDALLERSRSEQQSDTRHATIKEAASIISDEHPAVFLFQPVMTYVVKRDVIVSPIETISKPSDRFSNVNTWYTDSDTLWPIFKK